MNHPAFLGYPHLGKSPFMADFTTYLPIENLENGMNMVDLWMICLLYMYLSRHVSFFHSHVKWPEGNRRSQHSESSRQMNGM